MENSSNTVGASRSSVLQLAIKEKNALLSAYIPMFPEGGIFIPTERSFRLGDDVYVLLSLPEDNQRYPIAGKVAWVNPVNAGHRVQGIGVSFPKEAQSQKIKAHIEQLLGALLGSERPTQTI